MSKDSIPETCPECGGSVDYNYDANPMWPGTERVRAWCDRGDWQCMYDVTLSVKESDRQRDDDEIGG